MKTNILREIEIPEDVDVKLEEDTFKITGQKGTNKRVLKAPGINLEAKDNKVLLSSKKDSRNEKRNLNTIFAHINNMILGVQKGFTYKLKICSGHFPMKVSIEGNKLVVNNFLGEKIPRKANIYDGIKVEIENDIISVSGSDKEKTSQTAANIEKSTAVRKRDRRIFMDGIWIIKKAENE